MPTADYSPEIEQQTREQIKGILTRSAVDTNFRHRLLTQPNATYSEATGKAVPAHITFKFVENRGGSTFVLPPFGDQQLSEGDLEMVSGGTEPVTVGAVCLAALAVTTGFAFGLWLVKEIVS